MSAEESFPADPEPLVDATDVAAAAHDDAQNCLFVGTQCTPDSFGACISRNRILCCFNAPLARLAQEAAVGQFGRGFGTVEAPNCSGLSGSEIGLSTGLPSISSNGSPSLLRPSAFQSRMI